jgi:predicted ArsR family transcriptional regulator
MIFPFLISYCFSKASIKESNDFSYSLFYRVTMLEQTNPSAISDRSADRLLYALKASGPQVASTLAGRLAITSVAVRQHLERLEAVGLVAFEDRRETIGRPKRYWRLTARGEARFPDNHSGLTLELLTAAGAVFGEEGLDRLIAHRERETLAAYGRHLAGAEDLGEKIARLAGIRDAEGYMAEMRSEPDGSYLLIENHCPICVAATKCLSLCRSELSVFQSVLGANARIERVEHIIMGARRCAYRVTAIA